MRAHDFLRRSGAGGKLTAMGVLPGAKIEMVRMAPFGQAYYIKVDGVRLALRAEEAAIRN